MLARTFLRGPDANGLRGPDAKRLALSPLLGVIGLLGIIGLLGVIGCTGPKLRIQNPEQHDLFVDGQRIASDQELTKGRKTKTTVDTIPKSILDKSYREMAFRYYGTTRIDALPRIRAENGIPRVDHQPAKLSVEVSPPASLWLFPLDFAVELVARTIQGRPDQTAVVTAPAISNERRLMVEIPQSELGKLSDRGRAARIER